MKLNNIYIDYTKELEHKTQSYKKLAIFNYFLFASFWIINLLPYLFLKINNDLLITFLLILIVIIKYFVNIIISIVMLIHAILQGKVNRNIHTIINFILTAIVILLTITLILF